MTKWIAVVFVGWMSVGWSGTGVVESADEVSVSVSEACGVDGHAQLGGHSPCQDSHPQWFATRKAAEAAQRDPKSTCSGNCNGSNGKCKATQAPVVSKTASGGDHRFHVSFCACQ